MNILEKAEHALVKCVKDIEESKDDRSKVMAICRELEGAFVEVKDVVLQLDDKVISLGRIPMEASRLADENPPELIDFLHRVIRAIQAHD